MVENSYSMDSAEESCGHDDGEPSPVVYLNHAGHAPLAPEVKNAGIYALQRPPWEMPADDDPKRVREMFASLIEAEDASDIAIMPSTAFAISLAARNIQKGLPKNRKGRILIIQDQMCSAVYPWQELCEESNGDIELDIVPHPTTMGGGWTESILKRIDENVLVACLPPLHWSDGALVDLEAVGAACRKYGIILIVDATQAIGIMPCSVKKLQPTLLACSVHKWLRGPSGVSLVYVSPTVRSTWQPLDYHGRGRDMAGGKAWDASKDEMGPKGYPEKFYEDSRKFDSGGKPNPILLPMLRASMEQVVLVDTGQAQKKLKDLTSPLLSWAKSNGYSLSPGHHAFHLIGIRPSDRTPEEMVRMCQALQEKGIFIAVRCGVFRISPYLTNTEGDVQKLIDGLESLS